MIRRLFLLCLTVFCATSLRAGDNYLRDSLLVELETIPHNTLRLNVLHQLVKATQDNVDECRVYNKQLFDEAELQDNDRYRCQYYFTEMVFAYNTLDSEKIYETAKILIPLAREAKSYGIMFRAWRCKIDFMILSQDFERNEREAKRMLAEAQELDNETGILEAYQCLGNIYSATYRKADAIAILEQGLPVAMKAGTINPLTNIWQPLLFLYNETADYPKWIALLNEADRYINSLPADKIRLQHLFLLILYSSYIEYYTATDDLTRAEYYMRRAGALLNEASSPLYKIYYNKACSGFYEKAGDYEKALEWVDDAIVQFETLPPGDDYYHILSVKAGILNKMGRYEDAIGHLKAAIAYKDSLQVVTINKQYEQLKKDFNADQLLIEKTELQNRQQVYMLGLLGLGLAVIAGFVVYLMRSHRTLQKAECEMRAMNYRMEQVNEAKNRFLSNISNTIREPLNTVVEGSLALAERRISDSDVQQRLSAEIRKKSASLLDMINDILDLSRLEAGMMKFDMSDVEATSMLYDAASATENAENKITVRGEYPQNTLFMVHLDGGRQMQVFKTLFTADKEAVVVTAAEAENMFRVHVAGSILARPEPEQDIIIRNEINRMLVVRFGGTYSIEGTEIVLTLPLIEKIHVPED